MQERGLVIMTNDGTGASSLNSGQKKARYIGGDVAGGVSGGRFYCMAVSCQSFIHSHFTE